MKRNILAFILLVSLVPLLVLAVQSNLQPLSFGKAVVTIPQTMPSTKGKDEEQKIVVNEVEKLNLQNNLQAEIHALGVADNVSLYYKNLENGYEVTINPDRSWIPASMVKAFIVVEAFRQRRLRLINFDSRVTVRKNNVVPTELEVQEYQPLRAGVKATIRELVDAMIVQSDNTAFNTLIDILDRRNITSSLRRLGLNDTVVGEKLSLDDEQYQIDLLVTGRQPNRTTVRDFGRLFVLFYEGKIDDSVEMLEIFKKQKLKNMIPGLLPSNIEIAHKTGMWSPYLHDGGIVYKPGDPFVLVVFTNTDNPDVIARLAKISWYKTRDVLGLNTASLYGTIIEFVHWVSSLFEKALKSY